MNQGHHPTHRQQAAERACLIHQLGYPPEPEGCPRDERYAATTGELFQWVAERFGLPVAERCRAWAKEQTHG